MSFQGLAKLGCGVEMINAAIDNNNIKAAIKNAQKMFLVAKKGVKSGCYTMEDSLTEIVLKYYNQLKNIEYLISSYKDYQEDFSKIKLQIEKYYQL